MCQQLLKKFPSTKPLVTWQFTLPSMSSCSTRRFPTCQPEIQWSRPGWRLGQIRVWPWCSLLWKNLLWQSSRPTFWNRFRMSWQACTPKGWNRWPRLFPNVAKAYFLLGLASNCELKLCKEFLLLTSWGMWWTSSCRQAAIPIMSCYALKFESLSVQRIAAIASFVLLQVSVPKNRFIKQHT